jgi:hypothetical protein
MKLSEILERLRQPIPQRLISSKTLKGHRIDYISWVDLADLLDERCGLDGWSWKLIDSSQVGNRLTQVWELTIIGEDRALSRQASGDEDIDLDAYGTPATNVEAQCLRRCCSKFGIGRFLWRKDQPAREPQLPTLSPMRTVQPLSSGQITREEWLRRQHKQEPLQKF